MASPEGRGIGIVIVVRIIIEEAFKCSLIITVVNIITIVVVVLLFLLA